MTGMKNIIRIATLVISAVVLFSLLLLQKSPETFLASVAFLSTSSLLLEYFIQSTFNPHSWAKETSSMKNPHKGYSVNMEDKKVA